MQGDRTTLFFLMLKKSVLGVLEGADESVEKVPLGREGTDKRRKERKNAVWRA